MEKKLLACILRAQLKQALNKFKPVFHVCLGSSPASSQEKRLTELSNCHGLGSAKPEPYFMRAWHSGSGI